MPVGTLWLIPGRVIYQCATENLTLDEIAAVAQFNADLMTNEGQPPNVHLIMDYENIESIPSNFIKTRQASAVMVGHPMMEWGVGVQVPGSVINFVATTFAQLFRVKYKAFNTYKEAVDFLKWIDPSLDDAPLPPPEPPREGWRAWFEGSRNTIADPSRHEAK